MDSTPRPRSPSGLRFALDFGPLLVFFLVQKVWGILAATAVLIPASLVAVALTWRLERRLSQATLIGTGLLVVFGVLTLLLREPVYLQMKVTAINVLLAAVLGVGLLRGKSLLKVLFGEGFQLTDRGWRLLTARFALFFLGLGVLNEVLRRVLSMDAWVNFKVFGILGLTFVFTLIQAPLLQKHAPEPSPQPDRPAGPPSA